MPDPATAERPRDLLVAGHVNVDRFLRLAEFPRDDRTVPVAAHRIVLGGTAGNLALAATRLGVRTGLVARIGHDFPSEFHDALRRSGIDLRGLERLPRAPTPTAYILEDRQGHQRTLMDQGAMDDRARARRSARPWIREYSWVHLTTGPPELQLELAREARRVGASVAADPAQEVHYRWSGSRLGRLLAGAEILFGNRAEIDRVGERLGARSPERLLELVPLIVRTEGAQGATAFSRAGTIHAPARRPRRVRTVVGAGDRFRAGFYAAWFRGEELRACLAAGTRAAALALEGREA